jgi:hypothetical protein
VLKPATHIRTNVIIIAIKSIFIVSSNQVQMLRLRLTKRYRNIPGQVSSPQSALLTNAKKDKTKLN